MIGLWLVMCALALTSLPARAFDQWEPDGSIPTVLWPGAAPQRHDLEAAGGVGDTDLFLVPVEQHRSYEVLVTNVNNRLWSTRTLERLSLGFTVLQTGALIDRGNKLKGLRWTHADPGEQQYVRVVGFSGDTAADFYEIALRETTLYCPRFNNTNSQVSVLIIQRGAAERAQVCLGNAYFYDEDQVLVGSQSLIIGGQGDVNVYSLPGVPGLAGEKGGAQIAHTCGLGGLKAKLVALEPATGFSFDTPCTVREH